jgi:23S rRNA (adenine2503-C2)-methyltransferase
VTHSMKKDIRDLAPGELERALGDLEQPPHRARQISRWLYAKNALSFEEMTDLPGTLIDELNKMFYACSVKEEESLLSRDGTRKFLWRLADGERIESVLITSGSRKTLCVSTQVGCRFGCPFCASGARGFSRNLSPGEITGQIAVSQRIAGEKINNIVFMGMGEPLDNYENLVRSIHVINHPDGIGIGARKITVSTCGLVPGILKLKDLGIQVELSVSLHAADDELRNRLVPVNRKYGLDQLLQACAVYTAQTGRVITLEYTLIKDVNDSSRHAGQTAQIARRLKAKVNIIRCNAFGRSGYEPSTGQKAELFLKTLRGKGVNATIRRSKGGDISASCGQLALRKDKDDL